MKKERSQIFTLILLIQKQPKSLWERFSVMSVNSDDLNIEESHLLPDLSSDPDVTSEAPQIVSDEDLMRAVREMRQGEPMYDNRYLWDQREMTESLFSFVILICEQ